MARTFAIPAESENVNNGEPAQHGAARSLPSRTSWMRAINWVSLVVLVACCAVLVRFMPVDRAVESLQSNMDKLGMFAPVIFAGAYILAGLMFVPGSALTLASGALFGLLWGTVIVSIASTITAALAFLIARYLARARVHRIAQGNARFAAVDRAIGLGGWKVVALLRLSPAVPFSLGNYLYGLTSIRFWPYVLASWLCMLPGTFMYVYIGHIGVQGLKAAGGAGAVDTGRTALLVVGLIATMVVTVYVTRLARRALATQGALTTEATPNVDESVSRKSPQSENTLRTIALPIAALMILTGTIVVWARQDALRGLFGPPNAVLQEAYNTKAEGAVFDHSRFDALLRKHVIDGGWVDYERLQHEEAELNAYLAALEKAPFEQLSRDEKLALLINAYNACTLRLILDHYPLESIKDIPSARRWDDVRWKVAGNTWSLNQIEHEEIRPKFLEPRIHFALVCAAVGCPPLLNEAYVGARLEQQLEAQTRYVHSHTTWNRFDQGAKTLYLTPLYKWYGGDFEQAAGSVLKFVAKYVGPVAKALESDDPPRIAWLEYDWKLNDTTNRVPR